MINTNKGLNTKAYNKAKGKVSNKANANNKASNNNNILANALIDYVACIDSVSNICIKYNITRQSFYKYKNKLSSFYNVDYHIKHKQSKKALYDMLMLLKHIDSFAKSNNTLLDYAGKAFYSNIQNLLNTKRHDKLSNNIDKLAKNDVFNDVLSNDNANNDLQDNNAILQASNDLLSSDVMLDSGNLIVDNDFFASIAGDNNLIHANNEINTLETELILNDSFACDSNASNDLLLSSETSQDKANNKALNANDVINRLLRVYCVLVYVMCMYMRICAYVMYMLVCKLSFNTCNRLNVLLCVALSVAYDAMQYKAIQARL